MPLRYDEQEDEAHYDTRDDADDDIEKGRIKFSKKKLYGRGDEIQKLDSIYRRLRESSRKKKKNGGVSSVRQQTVFIPGYSGIGKSALVSEFIKQMNSSYLYIAGKYDEHLQSADPFSAIATGLRGLCSRLLETENKENNDKNGINGKSNNTNNATNGTKNNNNKTVPRLQQQDKANWVTLEELGEIRKGIRKEIGKDNLLVLAEIVPEIEQVFILPEEDRKASTSTSTDITSATDTPASNTTATKNNSDNNSIEKLKYTFVTFMKALSSRRSRPLIMFLDDLQWIDEGSLDLLTALCMDTTVKYFMFIGSYRSNEVDEDHCIHTFIKELEEHRQKSNSKKDDNNNNNSSSTNSNNNDKVDKNSNHSGSSIDKRTKKDSDVGKNNVEHIYLSELSLNDINEFIMDSLQFSDDGSDDEEEEDVSFEDPAGSAAEYTMPLTKAIYNKSLGNIFFTMQALEELNRRNGIYYDVMTFQWQYNLSKIEVEDLLSKDVIGMVKSKILHLADDALQIALITASFARSNFDIDTLYFLLQEHKKQEKKLEQEQPQHNNNNHTNSHRHHHHHHEVHIDSQEELQNILDRGVIEGLLLNYVGSKEYTFAHDRIKEASNLLIEDADDRNRLKLHIANALMRRYHHKLFGEDWMIFAALYHLNSLPQHIYDTMPQNVGFDKIQLAILNLQAGKLSIEKSAFGKAVESFSHGLTFLQQACKNCSKDRMWNEHYGLCLDLHNNLLETLWKIGNNDEAQIYVDSVLQHSKNNRDKILAQFVYSELIINQKNRDYKLAYEKLIEFLACHNIHLPHHPSKMRLMKDQMLLRKMQGRRELKDLLNYDLKARKDKQVQFMTNGYHIAIMRLLEQMSKCTIYTNEKLCILVGLTSQRLSYELGMNKYLPAILPHYGILLRKQGKLVEAVKIAEVVLEMLNKVCEGSPWVRGMNACAGCIIHFKIPFVKTIDSFKEVHRVGLACGDTEWACMGAMMFCYCYINSGWPINSLFESKVVMYEDEARRQHQAPSVVVVFSIFRQFILNLFGKGNRSPSVLDGSAMIEQKALEQFETGSPTYKQTLRDISTLRLVLSCIFLDLSTTEAMLERLKPYPEFDFPVSRQHLRDVFMGLGAYSLGTQRNDSKYLAIGKAKLKMFKHLAHKVGSENALPIVFCLTAEDKRSKANYDKAIEICDSRGLLHLSAMMNERCALFLMEQEQLKLKKKTARNKKAVSVDKNGEEASYKKYMTEALWLYYDWGALGKVQQLRQQHPFLHGVNRKERQSSIMVNYITSSQFRADGSIVSSHYNPSGSVISSTASHSHHLRGGASIAESTGTGSGSHSHSFS